MAAQPLRRERWELPLGVPGRRSTCHKYSLVFILISLCLLVSDSPSMGRGKGVKRGRRRGHVQREIARISLFYASPSPYPGRQPVPTLPWGIMRTGSAMIPAFNFYSLEPNPQLLESNNWLLRKLLPYFPTPAAFFPITPPHPFTPPIRHPSTTAGRDRR